MAMVIAKCLHHNLGNSLVYVLNLLLRVNILSISYDKSELSVLRLCCCVHIMC